MQIVVTGVAGFIGANLAEYLLERGHKVLGLDNFNDYYPRKIKEFNISSFANHPDFKLIEADITDVQAMEGFFKNNKIDALVHLAAWAGVTPSIKNPHIYAETNYVGTDNLATMCVKYGIKNFIFASTSSIYGNNNQVPFVESMDTSYVAAPYPASKKAGEVLLYSYSLNHDLNISIFRFFNPLGKYQRPDTALPKLVKSALFGYEFPLFQNTKNNTARDYTYVMEMCKAIENVINNPHKYEIFNLGNSKPETLATLIALVEQVTEKKIKTVEDPRPGQMETTFANIEKARNILDYQPTLSLRDIIDMYYTWFLKQPEWYQREQINK